MSNLNQTPIIPPIVKLSSYFYKTNYSTYELPSEMIMDPAGCSSFKLGNKVGRNFDWFYNNQVTFAITCNKDGAYKSVGIASHTKISEELVSSGTPSIYYNELPWYTLDGVNEKGLYASMNVVPDDISGGLTDSSPTSTVTTEVDAMQLVRHILDNYDSVQSACDDISAHVKIKYNRSLASMHYGLHTMLADKTSCVVLEVINGTLNIIQSDKSTNFWIHGVTLNSDGKVYSNKDVPTHTPTTENGITPYGSGLERWNIICDYMASGSDDARGLLNQLTYTKTYTSTSDVWYSEFVSRNPVVTIDTPASDSNMTSIINTCRTKYQSRTRDENATWQTTHSSVYDLDKLTLSIIVQEDNSTEKTFGISILSKNEFLLKVNGIMCQFNRLPPNTVRIGDRNYPYVKVGNLLWMAENLIEDVCTNIWFGNEPTLRPDRGRFYFSQSTHNTDGSINPALSSIIPNNWRLPTESDFNDLLDSVGNGSKLVSTEEGGTDDYGFNAKLGGYYTVYNNGFDDQSISFFLTETRYQYIYCGAVNLAEPKLYLRYPPNNWRYYVNIRLCKNA